MYANTVDVGGYILETGKDFVDLFKKNESIASVPIWLGVKDQLEIASSLDTEFLSLNIPNSFVSAKLVMDGQIVAPVKKGDPLNGRLVIKTRTLLPENGGERTISFPLIANETIDKGGILVRVRTNFRLLKKQILDLFQVNQ